MAVRAMRRAAVREIEGMRKVRLGDGTQSEAEET